MRFWLGGGWKWDKAMALLEKLETRGKWGLESREREWQPEVMVVVAFGCDVVDKALKVARVEGRISQLPGDLVTVGVLAQMALMSLGVFEGGVEEVLSGAQRGLRRLYDGGEGDDGFDEERDPGRVRLLVEGMKRLADGYEW